MRLENSEDEKSGNLRGGLEFANSTQNEHIVQIPKNDDFNFKDFLDHDAGPHVRLIIFNLSIFNYIL